LPITHVPEASPAYSFLASSPVQPSPPSLPALGHQATSPPVTLLSIITFLLLLIRLLLVPLPSFSVLQTNANPNFRQDVLPTPGTLLGLPLPLLPTRRRPLCGLRQRRPPRQAATHLRRVCLQSPRGPRRSTRIAILILRFGLPQRPLEQELPMKCVVFGSRLPAMASLAIGPLRVQRLGYIPLLDEPVASLLTPCASQPTSGLLGSCRDAMNDASVTAGAVLRPRSSRHGLLQRMYRRHGNDFMSSGTRRVMFQRPTKSVTNELAPSTSRERPA
jgi:hypothetical protein